MDRDEMERLTTGIENISEKIRILFRAGVERSDIATFLDRRYQQVQNVLKRSGLLGDLRVRTESNNDYPNLSLAVITVEKEGRITLPPEFMASARLREGDELFYMVDADRLTVLTRDVAERLLVEAAERHMPGQAGLLQTLLGRDLRSRS